MFESSTTFFISPQFNCSSQPSQPTHKMNCGFLDAISPLHKNITKNHQFVISLGGFFLCSTFDVLYLLLIQFRKGFSLNPELAD